MSEERASRCSLSKSPRRFQFSLRAAFGAIFVLAVALAIASRFPRHSAFAALMSLLLLFPLAVASALRTAMVRFGPISDDWRIHRQGDRDGRILSTRRRLFQYLGLCQPADCPSLAAGFTVAVLSSIALAGLWPAIREIGLLMALVLAWPLDQIWDYATRSIPETFLRGEYWLRLGRWELWSLGRWWLLFGAVLSLWLVLSSPFRRWLRCEPWSRTLARFLLFAPWLVVLEVAFLIGVWIESPNTVPEPSTGFVVGIFSWNLWHWDCWMNRGWMIRGALPTFVAGCAFFTQVLRWRRLATMIAALLLIPIALMLSVACTVAYQHGLPPLL
ncbi:MAG TPA: hypothetical protein VN699_18510 [Pirellulales bacterium]|nr:hypothetical protein [Pirellulales bacterium]